MANAGGMAAMHVWNIFDEVVLIAVVSAGGWDDGFLTYGFTLL
jgi:hypothetical protein